MNSAYENYCRKLQVLGDPNMRVVGTPLSIVAGTQNYNLPAAFDRMIEESVQYAPSGSTYGKTILPIVSGPDAEIWESMGADAAYSPQACRIVSAVSPATTPLQ